MRWQALLLRHPDRFELAARKWRAHARITAHGHAIVDSLGLDPDLAYDLETACRLDDRSLLSESSAQLLRAVDERLAELGGRA